MGERHFGAFRADEVLFPARFSFPGIANPSVRVRLVSGPAYVPQTGPGRTVCRAGFLLAGPASFLDLC